LKLMYCRSPASRYAAINLKPYQGLKLIAMTTNHAPRKPQLT